jgi:hypothetical protein
MINLRDYQQKAVDAIRRAYAHKNAPRCWYCPQVAVKPRYLLTLRNKQA